MNTGNRLPKDIVEGMLHSVEFQISATMVERFADLTSDFSSLHTDKTFGRRSMYRENVVHGMLPVSFISALKVCSVNEHRCSLRKISAKFLKPTFVNDKLSLRSKILELDQKQNQIEVEYILKNVESGSTLTTGYFTLEYTDAVIDKSQTREPNLMDSKPHMVVEHLVEQDLQFEQICKGDVECFEFQISEECAYSLYEILSEGFLPDDQFNFLNWVINCDATNLLAICLFSTFVGMCIPGKQATFMDFYATFDKPFQQGKKYAFLGQVGFKSPSTSTIVENISIRNSDNEAELFASGKINAKVNELPIKMPSIESLRRNELDLQLEDKVVLITGGSRGIGETTAKLFSLYGAKVIVNYFQGQEDANRIVDEITGNGGEALAIQADVSDRKKVKQMVESVCEYYGTIHILVNNAVRNFYPIDFMQLTWNEVEKDIGVIVKGAFNCCQEVIPLMVENQEGKIINISTIATDVPPPGQAKYVIAKSGLVGLTRSLAVEFAPHNIQVNMVVPGIVETDLTRHISKMFLEDMKNDTPMKRNASSIDVAKAVILLASSLTSFTTGQKIMVTGGNVPFL